jgi:hypothetical protein
VRTEGLHSGSPKARMCARWLVGEHIEGPKRENNHLPKALMRHTEGQREISYSTHRRLEGPRIRPHPPKAHSMHHSRLASVPTEENSPLIFFSGLFSPRARIMPHQTIVLCHETVVKILQSQRATLNRFTKRSMTH